MVAKKFRNDTNPAQLQREAEKARQIKKEKLQKAKARRERLSNRNPLAVVRLIEQLEGQSYKSRKDHERLESLRKDLADIRRLQKENGNEENLGVEPRGRFLKYFGRKSVFFQPEVNPRGEPPADVPEIEAKLPNNFAIQFVSNVEFELCPSDTPIPTQSFEDWQLEKKNNEKLKELEKWKGQIVSDNVVSGNPPISGQEGSSQSDETLAGTAKAGGIQSDGKRRSESDQDHSVKRATDFEKNDFAPLEGLSDDEQEEVKFSPLEGLSDNEDDDVEF